VRWDTRSVIAVMLCGVLISTSSGAQVTQKTSPRTSAVSSALHKELQRPYLELFREAARLKYRPAEIQAMRTYLKQAQDLCVKEFKRRREQLSSQLAKTQRELKEGSARLTESQRHDLHCRIQELRVLEVLHLVLYFSVWAVARGAGLDVTRVVRT
jgi:hypothetical protein